jgi:glycosyl transferase family 7 (putative galactosyltransferase)
MPKLHALIITHTHERIAYTLMGLGAQSLTPSTITVACDSDDEQIQSEIQRGADALRMPITLVLRKRSEIACRSQNRNNAVRALLDQEHSESDRLFFIDGDCIPSPTACQSHMDALGLHELSLGWAVRLSAEQTDELSEEKILDGHIQSLLNKEQLESCPKAHYQTRRRVLLRKLGMTKPHKPGILSGNFGVRLREFLAVNGFDESYTGWGMEDDDLARRLYMIGAKPKSAMDRAVVIHQFHPTEEPLIWKDSPNAHRLSEPCEARCASGIKNPASQHEPRVIQVLPK